LKNDFVAENCAFGLHAYGSDADHKLDNFELDGFVSWSHSGGLPKAACGNGWDIFIGGAGTIRGFKVTNSGTWRTDANRSVSIGYFYSNVQNQTAFLRNDVFTGSEALWTWLTPLDSANVKLAPIGSVPASGQDVKVLINAYEPGRANIAVWNWSKSASATASVPGLGSYEVRRVDDFYGAAVATGTGPSVTVPLNGAQFGAFIVAPVGTLPR